MSRVLKFVSAAVLLLFCSAFCGAGFAADFSYKGSVEPADATSRLLKYYIGEFDPESLLLITEEEPDETGLFKNIYMDITGCNISGVRIDRLTFQMLGAQFNPPDEWEEKEPECLSALEVYANCALLEDDINADLQNRVIGEDGDSWRNLKIGISPEGLSGSGLYSVKMVFTFDILIEIKSKLRIVGGQEVWLEDTAVKLNRLDVPDYITNMALDKIQPLLDLRSVPFPLRLNRITFREKEAVFETRILPNQFEGISYSYTR